MKQETPVKKLKRSNLSEDAYTYVRDLFLNGSQYEPGDKVSVEELSRGLGVSRTPLWGAINRLEAEGIVEIVPRQGVYLIKYDPRRALDIYEAREVLEGMAARLAAQRITPSQVAALKRGVDEQRRSFEDGNIEGYYATALDFHDKVASIAQNKVIEELLQSIFARMRVMRLQRQSMPMRLPQSTDDHSLIIAALEAGDPDAAEREARAHIRKLADQIRSEMARAEAESRPAAKSRGGAKRTGNAAPDAARGAAPSRRRTAAGA
jgi:DNA-binding GntR family transcriptional regulator